MLRGERKRENLEEKREEDSTSISNKKYVLFSPLEKICDLCYKFSWGKN